MNKGDFKCMQFSVEGTLLQPDDFLRKGFDRNPREVRAYLIVFLKEGKEVVPCNHRVCDERGHCVGVALAEKL